MMEMNEKASWNRFLGLRTHVIVSPEGGRRRVWDRMADLENQLAQAHQKIQILENNLADVNDAWGASLAELDSANERADVIKGRLELAVQANQVNMSRVDFVFPERPKTEFIDQATYPIDITSLRADLSEPITGKVTQMNPDTGDHETVETPLDKLTKDTEEFRLSLVRVAQRGVFFASPTHVPGMKAS
jgi:hypothetical protein